MNIHIATKTYPYSDTQLRRDNPQVSFPEVITDAIRASHGVYRLLVEPEPAYDPITHGVRAAAPVQINGEWTQPWEVFPLPAEEVAANQAAAIQAAREQAKAQRQAAVDAIKVTTKAGHTFDGDETSQTRMTRAVMAMQATGTASVTWVLADNTVIQATVPELTEALALAGAEQARLWVIE